VKRQAIDELGDRDVRERGGLRHGFGQDVRCDLHVLAALRVLVFQPCTFTTSSGLSVVLPLGDLGTHRLQWRPLVRAEVLLQGRLQRSSSAIPSAVARPSAAHRLGAAGRKRIIAELTWSHFGANVRTVVKDCVQAGVATANLQG
jgi:hypothetical protein